MDDRIVLGVLAVGAGLLVGVALFVPFVALSYRRRGGLGFWRFVGWAAFLVYFFAIWTYTLLPLPDPDTIRCVGAIVDPMVSVDEVIAAFAGPGNPLTSPQVLQLVFNVLLFVPLGFFVRVLLGRGFVVTVLIGFTVSLFVELTQLTGVWGIYPCAYRFFDVGDLITNTTGAAVGAALSLVVPRRHRGFARTADADDPDPVTKPRRLLAMVCDYVGAWVVSAAVAVGVQLLLLAVDRRDLMVDGAIASLAGSAVPALLWLVVVLVTGGTIGDLAVELRYTGGRLPEWAARLLRYLGGIGGYLLLGMLPGALSNLAGLLALVGAVMLLTTRRGRGLPGVLSGQELVDARSPRVPPEGVEVR